jgi:hypothetical protein
MRRSKLMLCVASTAAGLAFAGAAFADDQSTPPPASGAAPAAAAPVAAPPAPSPMANPAMSATLAGNAPPPTFDLGPLGKINVDGVVSGLFLWQSSPAVDANGKVNKDVYGDLSNAQIIVNKSDGFVQFYFQAGAYAAPVVGEPYYRFNKYDSNTFGYVPQGFLKLVPNANVSVEIGALPTLIGDEYTYTFENYNIERGLLWNQEPAVSKGVQLNVTHGSFAASLAVTDGYYSNDYSAISGLLTYTFKNSDTLAFAAEGNATTPKVNNFVTPAQQNDGQIYNLIFSHSQGPWTISPYAQFSHSDYIPGVSLEGNTFGGAVLAKYSFTPLFNLGGRVEYVGSSGKANLLGYGVNSDALSVTLTPTFQKGIFFARGEFSYVLVGNRTRGLAFGADGDSRQQERALFEAGVMF